jgi:hypothetical protein
MRRGGAGARSMLGGDLIHRQIWQISRDFACFFTRRMASVVRIRRVVHDPNGVAHGLIVNP